MRRLIVPVCVVLLLVTSAVTAEERPARPEDKVFAAMDVRVSCDFKDGVTLVEALDDLTEQAGIQYLLDREGLAGEGITSEQEIRPLKLDDVSLRTALSILLGNFCLDWAITGDAMLVTGLIEAASEYQTTRIFNVTDIVADEWADGSLHVDNEELCDMITRVIDPLSWQENGGHGAARAVITRHSVLLMVKQTHQKMETIENLLDELRTVKAGKAPKWVEEDAAWHKRFARRIDVDLDNAPFYEVLAMIADALDVNVVADENGLNYEGVSMDHEWSFQANDISIATLLEAIRRDLSLATVPGDNVLMFTSERELPEFKTAPRVYDVSAFTTRQPMLVDELQEMILSWTNALDWMVNGGPGALEPYGLGDKTLLIIANTLDNQWAVADLLAQMYRESENQEDAEFDWTRFQPNPRKTWCKRCIGLRVKLGRGEPGRHEVEPEEEPLPLCYWCRRNEVQLKHQDKDSPEFYGGYEDGIPDERGPIPDCYWYGGPWASGGGFAPKDAEENFQMKYEPPKEEPKPQTQPKSTPTDEDPFAAPAKPSNDDPFGDAYDPFSDGNPFN